MRIGIVILPEHSWPEARRLFHHVEDLGFAHAWTYDHMAWRSLRDGPWHAAVPLLTAVAATTSRIRLGTLVASPNYRHPVPFAKELMTLDHVSSGRFTLGIGAGSKTYDATVLGQPPWSVAERAARFAEFVELLDRLLTSPATTCGGRFYGAQEARMIPGCVQRPRVPFAVAATGPRGMAVVARHARTWITTGDVALPPDQHFEGLPRLVDSLVGACRAAGRDPATIDRLVLTGSHGPTSLDSVAQFTDAVARYRALGFTDVVVPYPRSSEPYAGDPAVLERIAALLESL
jgi:alkanesulfonate monooxygenase SsuD/methylene tetrahydromethanopterin reductase-like flavin-dependent oxidoreductase (luciferase family)